MDPFETLGVPARFEIDAAAVERAYLAAVASCHPDLAGNDPDRAADASRRAAALNRAKAVLLDPESRARALLERLGARPGADDRELPNGFLAEMLETRMAAQEAVAAGDQAEIARLRAWADGERENHIRCVGRLFAEIESPGADPAELAAEIRRQLNAWRYIERMLEQVG